MKDLLASLPPLDEPAPPPPAASPVGPMLLFLGPVRLEGAAGFVESTKRARLSELAAILLTHPGADHTTIDSCYYPGARVSDNGRNTAMSKLRRWLGTNQKGEEYLPRYHAGVGYRLHSEVTSDWARWQELLPAGVATASTESLEVALRLVRGRPFEGVRARHYSWAEPLKQQMINAIVDASYELARRHLHSRDWRAAEAAIVIGLTVEPGLERLWRARMLAAYAASNRVAVQEAAQRLIAIADELGGGLEPATQELLAQLVKHRVLGPPHQQARAR